MDFTYIEQLLQRYFAAETSLQEEHILREFFAQDDVPAHLLPWKPLFAAEKQLSEAHLDDSFNERILSLTGQQHVQARRVTFRYRLRPLFQAAACAAVAIAIGTAVEHSTAPTDSTPPAPSLAGSAINSLDELDASEVAPLDIRSAEATDLNNDSDIFVAQ